MLSKIMTAPTMLVNIQEPVIGLNGRAGAAEGGLDVGVSPGLAGALAGCSFIEGLHA